MAIWAKSKNSSGKIDGFGIKERIMRDLGFGLCVMFAIWACLANISYNSTDPSFNVATEGHVTNLLGAMGANFADLCQQIFGLIAIPLAIFIGAISIFALLKGPFNIIRAKSRFFVSLIGFALLTMAFAALPPSDKWSLASGFGGLIGDFLLWIFTLIFGHAIWANIIFGILALIGSFACAYYALNLKLKDIEATLDSAGFVWASFRVGFDRIFNNKTSDKATKPIKSAKPILNENEVGLAKIAKKLAPNAALKEEIINRVPIAPNINIPKETKEAPKAKAQIQPTLPFDSNSDFELPRLDLLSKPKSRRQHHDEAALRQNALLLMSVLEQYKVHGEIINVRPGPVVTLYELEPEAGIKSSRVINLAEDIARSMSAISCRVAVVKGRNAIGIELPNAARESVFLRTLLASETYENDGMSLPLALGETIGGEPYCVDLAKMPHLLIAGTTGSGKSVGINAMILSILYRLTPEQCRFIMIDPKMVELSAYNDIPHLLTPVVIDPKKAVSALKWTVREMENRYKLMSKIGVRNIASYNERAIDANAKGEIFEFIERVGFDKETGQPITEKRQLELKPMPFIVVVIDEMADLMMTAGKEIEGLVQRLAQMARAVGIHLIMATQRPSVDVITGIIKANFPTRISYMVTSKIDSRTILGEGGAEQLLGQGDLLFMANGGRINRLHGPFVSDHEVRQIVAALKRQGVPQYFDDITAIEEDDGEMNPVFGSNSGDELFDKAVEIAARDRKKISISYLQRQLKLGYNRAADLIDRMEREGIVSPPDHVGRRQVLLPDHN